MKGRLVIISCALSLYIYYIYRPYIVSWDGLEPRNMENPEVNSCVALRHTLVVKGPYGIVATTSRNVFELYLGLESDGDKEHIHGASP